MKSQISWKREFNFPCKTIENASCNKRTDGMVDITICENSKIITPLTAEKAWSQTQLEIIENEMDMFRRFCSIAIEKN